jgi:hypothetical protein
MTIDSAIILMGVVALCTLAASVLYVHLIDKFRLSIKSNDLLREEVMKGRTSNTELQRELTAARSEIGQLRSDLRTSGNERDRLKKELDDCLGRKM